MFAASFPDAEIEDLSSIDNLQSEIESGINEERRSLALLLLGIAVLLAITDFVLARLCSFRAVTHGALHDGGIA